MTRIRETRSKFLQVKCECGHEQIIFSHASSKVECQECKKMLSEPRGGKARILAEILQPLS